MADAWFAAGLEAVFDGTIGDVASADIRFVLCATNTDVDTLDDAALLSDFTLDEYDGSGAPSSFAGRLALADETLTHDTGNNRLKFSNNGTNLTVSSVGAGTRANQLILVYWHNTSDADSVPLLRLDASWQGNGGDINMAEHADGLGYIQT